ncbi:sugar ABC transporter ATP-binding protein [Paraburkholderia sp. CNPSo 3272]|uniref:sugar ABC transporter ATP-binding protein n=1 Tax=Paraburkholderia sp. CNPSo 3272 TaxID=2940931 RepID=UPI0020B8B23D|nr:sugar ABC transporter ATP-binding protein [Paraburkholderia sp. CNPSo 3272]MCP3724539.1 sugar ABC transporter ATP-binding protein [Paraburkholderia sp. CNPSo 3272]
MSTLPLTGAQPMPLLAAKHVSIAFNGTPALVDVGFDVRAGEVHALCGENGAGKSSLMKVLGGLYRPDTGDVSIEGEPVALASSADAIAAGIAVIHQELNLVDSLTVVDNLFLGKEIRGRFGLPGRSAMRSRAVETLARLGFRRSPDALVGELRVGEKQLIEIAKALLANARVLIMDEPTSALSDTEAHALARLVRELRDKGIAIVLISHRLQEVFDLADRVTVLRDGRHIATLPVGRVESAQQLVSMMIGKQFNAPQRDERAAAGHADTLIDVRGLTLHGEHRPVVHDVSFAVHRGEVFGLSGLLGAGKTEILETLFGVSPWPMSGEIVIGARRRHFASPAEAVEAGVGFVTEDRKKDGLLLDDTLEANLMLPSLANIDGFPFYRRGAAASAAAGQARASNVKCSGVSQTVATLSGGNQQKLIIGKWLMTRPAILLLDEPTRGVDVAAKAEIYTQILQAARGGLTVVVASSEIDELMLLCDRILVLCEGRAAGLVERDAFSAERLVELASP